MAWTSADLAALETAIKSGVRHVQYKDRVVTYHSLDEMLRLREAMKNDAATAAGAARTSCTLATFSKD